MRRLSALLLILAFSTHAYSWWSVGAGDVLPSTHNRITTRAVELLRGTNDYPDIDRFGDTIIGATSGFADDAIAHGKDPNDSSTDNAGKFNGGPFEKFWEDMVKPAYQNTEFTGDFKAYYRIGSMAHLVEDHAVPAHAANIYHGKTLPVLGLPTNPDDLEYWADSYGSGPGSNVTAAYSVKDPVVYYYKNEQNAAGRIIQCNMMVKIYPFPTQHEAEIGSNLKKRWIPSIICSYDHGHERFRSCDIGPGSEVSKSLERLEIQGTDTRR